MKKVLLIKVHDTVGVKDRVWKVKKYQEWNTEVPVLGVFKDFVLKELFCGVENYSRPPTCAINFEITEKHSAISS